MEFAVGADGGESLLLDACWAQLNPIQDGGIEDVNARVDSVAHKLDGLLDEAVDAAGVPRGMYDDAVFGGLFDFGHHDGAFLAVVFVELGELTERILADHITIQDEEGGGVFCEGFFGEFEGTCGAERLGFDGEGYVYVEFFFVL